MTKLLLPLAAVALLAGCAATTLPASIDASPSASAAAASTSETSVSITGGLETDPHDNGRPVVLVAGALGVAPEVFREAFSGVTPSTDGEPTGAEAEANKAALMSVLGPYGITNEQLDAASDRYRYMAANGELWPHTDATAEAVVVDGVVTGVRVISGGSGYTSAPTITLSTGQTATAELSYGTDVATNGSIASITLD